MIDRNKRCRFALGFALCTGVGGWAFAEEAAPAPDPLPAAGLSIDPNLSMDPSHPQVAPLPGGLVPTYGEKPTSEGEWRFDFHGFFTAPMNMGIGERQNPRAGQSSTVLHAPPVVPDDLETFSHTGVVPTTYAQLNFSEGNSVVTGNVSILARQASVSSSFLEPASQAGITDVYFHILPRISDRVHVRALLGAFTLRYGTPGEYDEGRYGTPLIARINGVGQAVSLRYGLGDWLLQFEEGFHGQTNKAGVSTSPDVWNNFADPGAGSSFVAHLHGGVSYKRHATLGLHYLRAFSQDDRAGTAAPDGRIDVLAVDTRWNLGRFGHAYLALSHVDALQSRTVSRIFGILNTQGGKGLMENYIGGLDTGIGNGKLTIVGGQYDLSIGRLVSYPVPFSGDGPDIYVSLFGMQVNVQSDDPTRDGMTKRKFGFEGTYSLLHWLAASLRYDQVAPNTSNTDFSFGVVSPRIILRSDWQATDQVVIQYSQWFNGSRTTVRGGSPPQEDERIVPDEKMLSISASMWW